MKRKNKAKEAFLARLPNFLIEHKKNDFKNHLNFRFKYFDNSQQAGQDFNNWTHEQLIKLLNKLKHYCGNTIQFWQQQKIGGGKQSVLEIYDNFPRKSEFCHPRHVPFDVSWARFRLEGDMRLIGFVLPGNECANYGISPNTFYIVFLDDKHKFYISR